jgi:hypothetical protein
LGDSAPSAGNLYAGAVATDVEEPASTATQQASSTPGAPATQLTTELADAKLPDVEGDNAQDEVGGGGGSALAQEAGDASAQGSAHDHGDLVGSGASLDLDQPLHALGLDLGGLPALDDLLHAAADQLGMVPLVGDLLGDVGHSVASAADGVLSGLTSVVSIGGSGATDSHGGATASAGTFNFAESSPSTTDPMVGHGGYSDYGIALHLSPVEAGLPSAGSDSPSSPTGGTLDDMVHYDSLSDISHLSVPAVSDALHADEAVLKTAADGLA